MITVRMKNKDVEREIGDLACGYYNIFHSLLPAKNLELKRKYDDPMVAAKINALAASLGAIEIIVHLEFLMTRCPESLCKRVPMVFQIHEAYTNEHTL